MRPLLSRIYLFLSQILLFTVVHSLIAQQPSPQPITLFLQNATPIYTCPDSAYLTDEVLPAASLLNMLGWNEDLDGDIYFLVRDDLDVHQVWLLYVEENFVLSSPNYRDIYPHTVSCRAGNISTTSVVITSPAPTTTSEIPLPHAMTVTPSPAPTDTPHPFALDSESQRLLDDSVNNTLMGGSLVFDLTGNIVVTVGDKSGTARVVADGTLSGMDDLRSLTTQHNITLYLQLDGQTRQLNVEERIVEGTFYVYGEDPDSGRQTRWLAIPLLTLLNQFFIDFGSVIPGGFDFDSSGDLAQVEEMNELLNLLDLSQYIRTERQNNSDGTVLFSTEVDIERFLDSEEDLSAAVSVLSALGGIEIAPDHVEDAVATFGAIRSLLVPHIELHLGAVVDPVQEQVVRLTIQFEATLGIIGENNMPDTAEIEVEFVVSISGHGEEYLVEAPEDSLPVDDLSNLPEDAVIEP